MAVYLIDFENVTSAGISGIQRLSKEDKVYIFYTVNASNMSFAAHMNLLSSPAEVIYYNVTSGGKNALDFQLASFLGYLISNGEDKDFYIISNDKGYDHVKNFWERSGIAEGVTIHSAPSINRSLMPIEKPFTSKIQQQAQGTQQNIAQQGEGSLEQLEQKKAAEAAEKEENVSLQTEKSKADTEINTTKSKKGQAKSENSAKNANETEAAEEPPQKRRGRPKKQTAETPENSGEIFANPAEALEKIAKEEKKPAQKAETAEKTTKAKSKEAAMKSLRKAIRPFLEKAGIKSDGDIINIANLLKSADGKQQFYCKLTKSYGMEKGLTAYKAVRTEYTNLTKLVKQ